MSNIFDIAKRPRHVKYTWQYVWYQCGVMSNIFDMTWTFCYNVWQRRKTHYICALRDLCCDICVLRYVAVCCSVLQCVLQCRGQRRARTLQVKMCCVLMYIWRDSFTCARYYLRIRVAWISHMICDIGGELVTCVLRPAVIMAGLFHMCGITCAYVWHKLLIYYLT